LGLAQLSSTGPSPPRFGTGPWPAATTAPRPPGFHGLGPRARRRAPVLHCPRVRPALYSRCRCRFRFPLLVAPSLFHPHLIAQLFNCHQNCQRASPLTWVAAAPSAVVVALRHPPPPVLSMPHCLKHRPPRIVVEAPKLPQRPPRMPPRRRSPPATAQPRLPVPEFPLVSTLLFDPQAGHLTGLHGLAPMSLSTKLPPPWSGPSSEFLASQTTKSESLCCQLVPGPALSHLITVHHRNRSSAMGAPLLLGTGPRHRDWPA
jgi:hypothetical protein